jgi:outer membrane protein assembly factor BamA
MHFQFIFISILISLSSCLTAQNEYIHIDSIEIKGLKHTQASIVYRTIQFTKGDSISLDSVQNVLEFNRYRLMNTELFSNIQFEIKSTIEHNHILIVIHTVEAWYIYPIPIFELADRNFNIWANEQNFSFSRINYGVNISHLNLRGIHDPLDITIQLGYTQKFSLNYSVPFVNKAKTIGLNGGVFYSTNKEIGYVSQDNRLKFRRNNDEILLKRIRANIGIKYTPGFFSKHGLNLFYFNNKISPFVEDSLNVDYFTGHKTVQSYFSANYFFNHDKRDIKPYPKKGYFIGLDIKKDGILKNDDRKTLDITIEAQKYIPLGRKLYWELIGKSRYALLRGKQDYRNYKALGYGDDYIRGFELYVMDGLDFRYVKSSFRFELLDKSFDVSSIFPINAFKKFPLKIYLTANTDLGHVTDPFFSASNNYNNNTLLGYGVGVNFVIYYNVIISTEYSFNNYSEKGLFLHFKTVY